MAAWIECPACSLEAIWSSDEPTVVCPTCQTPITARMLPSRVAEYRRASGCPSLSVRPE